MRSTCLCMTAGKHLALRSCPLNLNQQQIPQLLQCRQLQVAKHENIQFQALKLYLIHIYETDLLTYPSTAKQNLTREPEKEQQQPIESNFLSDTDFPTLGADVNVTKDQKSKTRDATQRESSASVFKEFYHSQLREVHGANVRAVEAMEEDDEELTGRKRNRVLDPEMINSLMEDVIRDIAAEGELVTKEKVRSKEDTLCILKE